MRATVHVEEADQLLYAAQALSECVEKGYEQCAFTWAARTIEGFAAKTRAGNWTVTVRRIVE